LKARRVLDSRGRPTVEASANEFSGIAPSGASTGKHELSEKRGKNGFLTQVKKINSLGRLGASSLSDFDEKVAVLGLGSSASTNTNYFWKLTTGAAAAFSTVQPNQRRQARGLGERRAGAHVRFEGENAFGKDMAGRGGFPRA
jgi:hypothetical protein